MVQSILTKKNIACFIWVSLIFFVSCGQKQERKKANASSVLEMRKLEKIIPKDANLSEKYKRSCLICHSNPDAKAPLVHDTKAWDKLIQEKGKKILLQNVVNGYNTMPAKGQCGDCTEEELKKLIEFLAGKAY